MASQFGHSAETCSSGSLFDYVPGVYAHAIELVGSSGLICRCIHWLTKVQDLLFVLLFFISVDWLLFGRLLVFFGSSILYFVAICTSPPPLSNDGETKSYHSGETVDDSLST